MEQPSVVRRLMILGFLPLGFGATVRAQQPKCDDQTIEQIRALPSIGVSDQDRIAVWIRCEVDRLVAEASNSQAAYRDFVARLEAQYANPSNSPAFKSQFAAQLAQLAVTELPKAELPPMAGAGIARALLNTEAGESLPGFVAGLKSPTPAVRFFAARGLYALRPVIERDKAQLAQIVAAIQAAGVSESDPIVVSHLYRALAYPRNVPEVAPAYLAILEARLALRRKRVANDGGEIEAFEFFRTDGVVATMSAEQKSQLAQRLAVLLRLDAERIGTPALSTEEQLWIERSLEAVDAILAGLTGKPAIITEELAANGLSRRAEILSLVAKWVGDPATNQAGFLNAAPLNVPVGAP